MASEPHAACDIALGTARDVDTRFGCSWRQQEVAELRDRGDRIARAAKAARAAP